MSGRAARISILAALLTLGLAQASDAGERKLFSTVKGWDVDQNVDKSGPQTCQIAYAYKDEDDENAENAVAVALDDREVIIVLGYENWTWDKDEKVTAAIQFDKQALGGKQAWIGDGTNLVTKIPDTAVPKLLKAKQIIVNFGKETADFNIPGVAEAYEAMKQCNAKFDPANAPPKTAAAPPSPMPSDDILSAFGSGLAIQKVIASCEISTTPKQRAEVDAKMLALQPAMGLYADEGRREFAKADTSKCPTDAAGTAKFDFILKAFTTLGPAEFTAALNQRMAEDEAKAKREAEARAKAETEAKMRAEIEAQMRAEIEAKTRAEAEAKARAEMEARIRSEVEAKLRAEAEAKAKDEVAAK